ncbi:hypothetical protein [Actinomyces israelii]|jgi:hypothetical protein|uniref:hypothetical protein n=1 Tax=Actinomyces israelii TaxID=1659 RepID=UPI0012EC7670|nr:hypothetical protein [Actinomyces israelii]
MGNQIDNPKLVAIRAIKSQATTSQSNLGSWTPKSSASTKAGTIDDGLTEDVWTSPVADDYRTKITAVVSGTDSAFTSIVSALTNAENEIVDADLEYVDSDSEEAKWPNSG